MVNQLPQTPGSGAGQLPQPQRPRPPLPPPPVPPTPVSRQQIAPGGNARPSPFGLPPTPPTPPRPSVPGMPGRPVPPPPAGIGQMPPRAPYPLPEKKGGAGKAVLIIVIIVLILATIAGAVYFFFLRPAPAPIVNNSTVTNLPVNTTNNVVNNTPSNTTSNTVNTVNTTPTTPDISDLDQDGLTATVEIACGTDEADADTDNDTFDDGTEVINGYDPTVPTAQNLDPSGNCVQAYQASLTGSSGSTSPSMFDSGTSTGGSSADPDNDRLTNDQESVFGTDPLNSDTDGDGVKDGDEVLQGTDPNGSGVL
jgi:hypothetical protein